MLKVGQTGEVLSTPIRARFLRAKITTIEPQTQHRYAQ